jgi:hypothetical protein
VFVDDPNNLDGRSNYIFDIALYRPNGEKLFRRLTVDTGAELNLISHYVCQDLGIEPEPKSINDHSNSESVGPAQALGRISVQWQFKGGEKTFNTSFWVLKTEAFDVLIGRTFIEENRLLKRKRRLWPLRTR